MGGSEWTLPYAIGCRLNGVCSAISVSVKYLSYLLAKLRNNFNLTNIYVVFFACTIKIIYLCAKFIIEIMSIKRTYISGAISGYDYHDRYRRFEQAEEEIFRSGEIPVNPMKNGLPHDADWHTQMVQAKMMLSTCQKMIVLPYWEDSKGVAEELELAELMAIEVVYLSRVRIIDGNTIEEKRPERKIYNPFHGR